jgi:hypothetical protein
MKKLITTLLATTVVGCATAPQKVTQVAPMEQAIANAKPSKPYVEPPKRDWREIYSDPRYLALVESQQQEARLQNIAIISSAAIQAGAAWYQSQQPVYNYYGPSPAATYFYGYEQNAQLRALNNNLSSQNAQQHQLSDDVWRLRRDLR